MPGGDSRVQGEGYSFSKRKNRVRQPWLGRFLACIYIYIYIDLVVRSSQARCRNTGSESEMHSTSIHQISASPYITPVSTSNMISTPGRLTFPCFQRGVTNLIYSYIVQSHGKRTKTMLPLFPAGITFIINTGFYIRNYFSLKQNHKLRYTKFCTFYMSDN